MNDDDVQEFCARYRSGDHRTCLALLYRCLKSPTTGRFRAISGCDEEAAELTQRAFCEAASRLAKLRKPDRVVAWFWGTVVRTVQTAYFREKKRETARRDRLNDKQSELVIASDEPAHDANDDHQAVTRFAEQQKDPINRLIVLHKRDGRTNKQIAEMLYWNEDRVKRRFQRLKSQAASAAGEDVLP